MSEEKKSDLDALKVFVNSLDSCDPKLEREIRKSKQLDSTLEKEVLDIMEDILGTEALEPHESFDDFASPRDKDNLIEALNEKYSIDLFDDAEDWELIRDVIKDVTYHTKIKTRNS